MCLLETTTKRILTGRFFRKPLTEFLAALNLAFDLADRSMAELQARRDQSAQPPPAATNPAAGNDPQLTALLQRLDRCLGDDGQLL